MQFGNGMVQKTKGKVFFCKTDHGKFCKVRDIKGKRFAEKPVKDSKFVSKSKFSSQN